MQTNRDAQIVDWLGRIGAAGAEHVRERFGMHIRVTHKRLASLVADGLLERHKILWGRPGLYCATLRGLRWQGLGHLGVVRVSPGGFEHAWQVAGVAVALRQALPDWRLLAEREIRALEIESSELLASVVLAGGEIKPLRHRPDLAAISPSGRVMAIEVERSVKAPMRLRQICRGWARARYVNHVYYLALPGPSRALARALDHVKATDRVTVLDIEDVAGLAAHALTREEARDVLPS